MQPFFYYVPGDGFKKSQIVLAMAWRAIFNCVLDNVLWLFVWLNFEIWNNITTFCNLVLKSLYLICSLFIAGKAFNLFAFPSECNFSGVKFNLDLANIMKEDPERILKDSPHCKYTSWLALALFFPHSISNSILLEVT